MRLFLFLCCSFSLLYAQNLTQTIRGKIFDQDDLQALAGVTILVQAGDTLLGTMSQEDGTFSLPHVPLGRSSLKASFIGYEDVLMNAILVGSGKEVVLELGMQQKAMSTQEVVVRANKANESINEMATVSSRSFSLEQSDRFAATMNDPARLALSFAGVAVQSDLSNEIVIRGNSPRGLLWRLEGVEIPNPNHFSQEGGGGGAVSMLNSKMLSRSDFFTGAFPAEYGNASSGVFDLRMKKGNNQQQEFSIELGTLGLEALGEGPLTKKKRASYAFHYRYSTLALAARAGYNLQGRNNTSFQDASFKIHIPTEKAGNISIFGLGGISRSGLDIEKEPALWQVLDDSLVEDDAYRLGVVGMSYNKVFQNSSYLKSTLSYSNYQYSFEDGVEDRLTNYNSLRIDANSQAAFRINTLYHKKWNAKHQMRVGFTTSQLRYQISRDEYIPLIGQMYRLGLGVSETWLQQMYMQWKYRSPRNWTINYGLHSMYMSLNQQWSIEPRIGLQKTFADQSSLNFGAGLHSRIESLSLYIDRQTGTPSNTGIRYSRAAHAVLGYQRIFFKDWHAKAELYYQYLYGVPVKSNKGHYSMINELAFDFSDKLENTGLGRNYGVELTLEKPLQKNYYVLANLSLFQSEYMGSDSIWRNTRYNGNYIVNFTGGKEFPIIRNGKRNLFGIHTKFLWAGGRRLKPINIQKSIDREKTVYDNKRSFDGRADAYLRWDISLQYKRNKPRYDWALSLDVQNVTNRKNELNRKFNVPLGRIIKKYQLGLIPILKYRVSF